MRQGDTNFAGKPSLRMSNVSAAGFGGSAAAPSFKPKTLSSFK
jgi:hypothetical protein